VRNLLIQPEGLILLLHRNVDYWSESFDEGIIQNSNKMRDWEGNGQCEKYIRIFVLSEKMRQWMYSMYRENTSGQPGLVNNYVLYCSYFVIILRMLQGSLCGAFQHSFLHLLGLWRP
jgi:hypothetical protein